MINMNKNIILFFTTAIVILLGACTDSKHPAKVEVVAKTPDVVSFKRAALYPEGVDWDAANKRFMVTSIREGVVGTVTDDGTYTVFAQDPRMVSAVGIRIDAGRDRVLVCNADPGASKHSNPKTTGKLAALAVFQLSTGKLIKYIDLAKGLEGSHFCNDIVIDKDGTAYISDSFSTIIYKVGPDYKASVFLNNKRFSGVGFNLNGMVIKDNYLLVDKYNDGTLFKVPLDNPEAFTQVKMKVNFNGADGLLWAPDGTLVMIANDSKHGGSVPAIKTDKVVKLTSSDNWASAQVVSKIDTGDVFATTGVVRDGEIYVNYAMLHVLFNPKTEKHIEEFKITKQNL
ncbi:MAG: SMP-30/gluconolactonase/LRE family protein [Gammaproteobacteria bacterium]|nr:MAG: SMP-30/gluconolactonase/LRE family protein [Gammaproteobacteria bacterium]